MFSQRVQNNQGNVNGNNINNGEYLVPRKEGCKIPGVDCYNYGKIGHMYFSCNKPDNRRNRSINILSVGYAFPQHNDTDIICKTWILIGNCSTDRVRNNREFVINVQPCDKDKVLDILNNVGSQRYMDKGTLQLLPIKVHMNTKYIATILAFKDVASIPVVIITMCTAKKRVILIHWNGNVIKFNECDKGLYFFDTAAPESHHVADYSKNDSTKKSFNNDFLITTVSQNKELYTQKKSKERTRRDGQSL